MTQAGYALMAVAAGNVSSYATDFRVVRQNWKRDFGKRQVDLPRAPLADDTAMIDGLSDLCVTPVNDRSALGHTCNQRYPWHRQDSSTLLHCGSDVLSSDRADVDRATVGDGDGEVALTWEAAAALYPPTVRE